MKDVSASDGQWGIVSSVAMIVGGGVVGLGMLLVPTSALGGLWIAGIGLALVLAGAVASDRVGGRAGLSAGIRSRLSLAFALVAAVLLVAFVVINFASIESGEVVGSA
jgi:hypothetical protein